MPTGPAEMRTRDPEQLCRSEGAQNLTLLTLPSRSLPYMPQPNYKAGLLTAPRAIPAPPWSPLLCPGVSGQAWLQWA